MTDRRQPVADAKRDEAASHSTPVIGEAIMKSTFLSALAVLILIGVSAAKELPDAPSAVGAAEPFIVEAPSPAPVQKLVEKSPIDATFISLAVMSTGSTFADSYTTLFARQNWLAGKKGVCNMEVESAYLMARTRRSAGPTRLPR